MGLPEGSTSSTGSPAEKSPSTLVMPAGSSELPRSMRAVTAPESRCSRPLGSRSVSQPAQAGRKAAAGRVEEGAELFAGEQARQVGG